MPRERDGLFDIVSWELPKTVRRRAAGSAVLIQRSAGWSGPANSNARTRVSKDEDERLGSPFMLRDASQRIWAVEAPALAMLLSMRAGAKHQLAAAKSPPAQFHCFRIVIYNDFCNSHVSAAFSARDFSKATFAQTWSRRHIRTGRPSISHGASPSHRATCIGAHPRMLVMKVAPLLRRQRKSSQEVVRGSFASRVGGWLRLSRPTQSLMTLA